MASEEQPSGHDDPANWKLGFLYYNKKDPRLFPPKRWSMGWTMNFANPKSIAAATGLIVLVVLVVEYLIKPMVASH